MPALRVIKPVELVDDSKAAFSRSWPLLRYEADIRRADNSSKSSDSSGATGDRSAMSLTRRAVPKSATYTKRIGYILCIVILITGVILAAVSSQ